MIFKNCKYVLEEAKLDLNERILEKNVEKIRAVTSSLKEKIEILKTETKKPLEDAETFGRLVNEHEKTLLEDLPTSLEKIEPKILSFEKTKQSLNSSIGETEAANEQLFLTQATVCFAF